jgi:hypothetical protein
LSFPDIAQSSHKFKPYEVFSDAVGAIISPYGKGADSRGIKGDEF